MKIEKVINTFKLVKTYFKVYLDSDNNDYYYDNIISGYICNVSKHRYGVNVSSLFSETGYYRHYMNGYTLYTGKVRIGTRKFLEWKVAFLETEIKELTSLLKQGYTDI